MKKNIKQIFLLVICIVLLAFIYILGTYAEKNSAAPDTANETNYESMDMTFFNDTWFDAKTDSDANAVTVSGEDVDGIYEITMPGDYIFKGLIDGTVLINAMDSNVHIVLDDAVIKAAKGPAIRCEKANKLVITLADGTENTISDSPDYESGEDADAAIFSECAVTINGTGKLGVDGVFEDAIHSRDVVKIIGGDISTKSLRYGINANDGVAIEGGNISISSKKDGIRTINKGEQGRGAVYIADGNISIVSGRSGIKTEKGDLYVTGGNCFVNSVAGIYNAAGRVYIKEGCINE